MTDLINQSAWVRYGVAVAAAVGAAGVLLLLHTHLHYESPMLLMVLPVILAAYVGGLGPGLVATGVGAVAISYLLILPRYSFGALATVDLLRLTYLVVVGAMVSLMAEMMHRSNRLYAAAARAAEHSEQRTQRVLSSVTDCYLEVDRLWRVRDLNARAAAFFGKEIPQVMGQNVWELWPEAVGPIVEEEGGRGQRVAMHFETGYCQPGGGRWAEVHAYPMEDGVGLYFRDITDRKESQEWMRISEERLRLAVESADIGTWDYSVVDGVLTCSARAREILGIAPEAPVDYPMFLGCVHEEDRARIYEAEQRAMDPGGGGEFEQEYRCVRPDGSMRWVLSKARVFFSEFMGQRRAVRCIGTIMDITERKRAEEQLHQAKAIAEGESRAKDQFLAELSHELRTPLTPVLMTAQAMAADASLPPPVRGELEMIGQNVQTEARLIDDLLDLTRITRGKLEVRPQAVDAHELIGRVVEACRKSEGKPLEFGVALEAREHFIQADPARIQQVVWNLLKNAVKFTPAGGRVEVRTWNGEMGRGGETANRRIGEGTCCRGPAASRTIENRKSKIKNPADPRSTLIIEVSDTGVGIEPERLGGIFNAFEQGGTDVTRRFGGLGLGLAICKGLVELHQGSIIARSEGKDRGATFRVELPTIAAPAGGAGRAAAPDQRSGRALSILLVEDHQSTARVLSQILRSFGHEVRVAPDVATGMALAGRGRFDLLISDLGLPDGSGLDLMRYLRARRHLPGIALSGYGMEEDVRRSREAGFSEHLVKPVTLEALEEALARMMGQAGGNGGQSAAGPEVQKPPSRI